MYDELIKRLMTAPHFLIVGKIWLTLSICFLISVGVKLTSEDKKWAIAMEKALAVAWLGLTAGILIWRIWIS